MAISGDKYYIKSDGIIEITFKIPVATLYIERTSIILQPLFFKGEAVVIINIITPGEAVDISFGPTITWSTEPPSTLDADSEYRLTLNTKNGVVNGVWGSPSAEINDLTDSVTWDDVPDANITQSSVTQHEGALSITESQITDLNHTDTTAIHDDVDGEISVITNKAGADLVDDDILLIEDSAGSAYSKKYITLGDLKVYLGL
jgi:hypothetical protein